MRACLGRPSRARAAGRSRYPEVLADDARADQRHGREEHCAREASGMADVARRGAWQVLGQGAAELADELRGAMRLSIYPLPGLRVAVAEIRGGIDDAHVELAARGFRERGPEQRRGGAVRSRGEQREARAGREHRAPRVGLREAHLGVQRREMREHRSDRFAAAALGHRGSEPKLRMLADQAQQLAAHIPGGTEHDGGDAHALTPSCRVRPSSAAMRSPSVAPSVSALIAGNASLSRTCSTPTALSVAGPLTTAGSMPYCSRRIFAPPQAATGSFAHRTTTVSASRIAGSARIASTP